MGHRPQVQEELILLLLPMSLCVHHIGISMKTDFIKNCSNGIETEQAPWYQQEEVSSILFDDDGMRKFVLLESQICIQVALLFREV